MRRPDRPATGPLSEGIDPKLRRVAELIDVGVVLLAADKSVDYASPRAEEITGISVEDTAAWDELLSDLHQMIEESWSSRTSGNVTEIEIEIDEKRRLVCFQVFFLDEEECVGFLVLVRDQSLQRALEADLAHAAQVRTLGSLHAGLAHDLRSPLNTIVLNLELLRAYREDGDDASWQETLDVLEDEARRLAGSVDLLMTQMLSPTDEVVRFDANELVRDLGRLLAGQARFQVVDLSVETAAEPLPVRGRREWLRRALTNVAINGLESTPEGGRLILTARRADDRVEIDVADTGPGVAETLGERVFDLHVTTRTSGTGVGLFVARSIAEADGGTLSLMPSESGALFRLSLPFEAEPREAA
ncbi:MAG: ATP-binding protein [Thermoanaerobaculia bacterium]